MGLKLTKTAKPTAMEKLETLERQLDDGHCDRARLLASQARVTGSLWLASAVAVFLTIALWYWHVWLSEFTWTNWLLRTMLMISLPLLTVLLRHLCDWRYRMALAANAAETQRLLKQRSELLNEIKRTETYNVAKQILERFSDRSSTEISRRAASIDQLPKQSMADSSPIVRRRRLNSDARAAETRRSPTSTGRYHRSMDISALNNRRVDPMPPADRSTIDKIVDYLLIDGPSNRYALICRKCHSHNGLALKDDFLMYSFRCFYCGVMNTPLNTVDGDSTSYWNDVPESESPAESPVDSPNATRNSVEESIDRSSSSQAANSSTPIDNPSATTGDRTMRSDDVNSSRSKGRSTSIATGMPSRYNQRGHDRSRRSLLDDLDDPEVRHGPS